MHVEEEREREPGPGNEVYLNNPVCVQGVYVLMDVVS